MTVDITFERAFELWKMDSLSFHLVEDEPVEEHDSDGCGWMLMPTDLIGGYRISVCYGCGGCYRLPGGEGIV